MKDAFESELMEMIKNRSCLKRDVYENMVNQFVKYVEKSKAEVHLTIAGDILVFHMHSNVFLFDKQHNIWQTSYVKDNPNNAFVGTINIYNFLNDSFEYNRYDDLGYMIARLFINKENHYFAEGKNTLGYKFNDFVNSKITKKDWIEIINTCVMYTLDFNLLVPPYRKVSLITVGEVIAKGADLQVKTGKRLGFQFGDDSASKIT